MEWIIFSVTIYVSLVLIIDFLINALLYNCYWFTDWFVPTWLCPRLWAVYCRG